VGTELYTKQRIVVDLRSAIGKAIYVKGQFDLEIGNIIQGILQPGDVFVDVGANVGSYAIPALLKVEASGIVFACEVDPRSLRCLFSSKMRFGYQNLVINGVAIGSRPGVISILGGGEMAHTYVLPDGGGHSFPMLPLDAFLPAFGARRVRLIKIDVEGSELDVLKGATALLEAHKPFILVEVVATHMARHNYQPSDLESFLAGVGYSFEPIQGGNDPCWLCSPMGPA
jgi:FkbM family methyltransferase